VLFYKQKRSEEAPICAAVTRISTLAKGMQRFILGSMIFIPHQQQLNQRSSQAAVFVCVCGML
jgi:hypothetical protein